MDGQTSQITSLPSLSLFSPYLNHSPSQDEGKVGTSNDKHIKTPHAQSHPRSCSNSDLSNTWQSPIFNIRTAGHSQLHSHNHTMSPHKLDGLSIKIAIGMSQY